MNNKMIFVAFLLSFILISKAFSEVPTSITYSALMETSDKFKILQTWTERSQKETNIFLKGVIFENIQTGEVSEVYFKDEQILSDEQIESMGIKKKLGRIIGEVSTYSEPAIAIAPLEKSTRRKEEVFQLLNKATAPPTSITLPPLPKEKLLQEEKDATVALEKGVYRIGIVQSLSKSVEVTGLTSSEGFWQVLPDASLLWMVDIYYPQSLGIRVRIEPLLDDPVSDALFWVVNDKKSPEDTWGPFYLGEIKKMDGWLPTCFADRITVVCWVPSDKSVEGVAFKINEVIGIYKDPMSLLAKAGSCNLDITCYTDWYNTSKGITGLGIVGTPYALFCTGTLLNDNDPCSQIPYVLTANHCVNSQTGTRGGDSVEFYWFYQTPSCNGTPPSLSTLPRTTGGADYLAGMGGSASYGGGNDFTLLRMRNEPPEGAVYVGWTTTVPSIGTAVTDIHHPSGSYKRISFGTKTNINNLFPNFFHEVQWSQGTTEPGSSGSPLMLTSTQQIIGQLWGGGASCSTPDEPDYFGRFDITYNFTQQYLEQPKVRFHQQTLTVTEANTTQQILVLLSSPARVTGSEVELEIETINAQQGTDFTISTNPISFAPNATQTNITITFFDNTHTESDKTIRMTFRNPQCIRFDTTNQMFEITILDNDTDTDGDGLSDYDETNGVFGYTSDPNKTDTDNDGISDYDEVRGTYGFITNPGQRDTDGDGVNDWLEIHYGTDPTDPYDAPSLPSISIPWFK
ncbi:MAG TPA: Calx-beta domain-containing protein [Candidatus Hydrogenedens sp.]|nr:Calx-beta domain-containing protein [Candidatus Hydrogenedens sp.]